MSACTAVFFDFMGKKHCFPFDFNGREAVLLNV